MSRTSIRATAAFGIAHVALLMGGFSLVISDDALMESSREQLTSYFIEGSMQRVLTGGFLEALGLLCFIPFAAGLTRALREGPAGRGFAPTTALAAAAVYVTLSLSPGMGGLGAAVWLGHSGTDVEILRALIALRTFSYFLSLVTLGVFLGAVTVAVVSARSWPRWVGVSAAVVAVGLVAGVATDTVEIPSLLALIWVVGVSVSMLRRPSRYAVAEPARRSVGAAV